MLELLLLPGVPGYLPSALLAGVFGLLIGSFLNVVIHRVPKMMQRGHEDIVAQEMGVILDPILERLQPQLQNEWSDIVAKEIAAKYPHKDQYDLVLPRSACPKCGHKITALENIPVISYLVLGGKCRGCKTPISSRYPIVELLTGVLSGLLVWHFGAGLAGLSAVLFAWFLIAMTFIDADTQFLPDDLTLPLMWIGLLVNTQGTFTSLKNAVIGAAAGYLLLWTINYLFKLIRKKDGMGYGDFKLLAALGAWMGWTMLPLIILLSSLVGAMVGIALIILAKMGKEVPIPFGPYLAGAGLIALIWGQHWTQIYLSLYLQ
jgi:leader peptidase (prepilin peptidase)/N-methyltransferase